MIFFDFFNFWFGLLIACSTLLAPPTLQECLSEYEINEIPSTTSVDLYRSEQAFAFDLLKTLQKEKPDESIFFSPYSTYRALLLVYFGARGKAEQELINVLRLQWAKKKIQVSFGYLFEKRSRAVRADYTETKSVFDNKIFFNNNLKLRKCLTDQFIEEIESKDFRNNAEQSRTEINAWVASSTDNQITNMFSADDVTGETKMLLANAAFFEGQFKSLFNASETRIEVFYKTVIRRVNIKMLHKRSTYNIAIDERLGAFVIQIPFLTFNDKNKESDISMVIILPPFIQDGIEKLVANLSPDSLDMALKKSTLREVDITLPTFEFEKMMDLKPTLLKMGLSSIFSTQLSSKLDHAKHVAKINIIGEGFSQAEASFSTDPSEKRLTMMCNHPFVYLLYDHYAKAVLFAGIYSEPLFPHSEYGVL